MIREVLYYVEGLDESVLKLNDSDVIDNCLSFKLFTTREFLETFKSLIPKKENGDYDYDVVPALGMPYDYAIELGNSKYFNQSQIINDKHIILLRYTEPDNSTNYEVKINRRVKKLIETLKLIKSGHIKIISEFEFTDSSGCIPISHSFPSEKSKKYSFDHDDIIDFGRLKEPLDEPPTYLNLALESFFESYNIENEKLRFVILMTCLESIFNKSPKDIAHSISRYTAIVLSIKEGENTFQTNYKTTKDLYSIRSTLVHSKSELDRPSKEYFLNPTEKIEKLEEIVRNVLKELILKNEYSEIKSKNELLTHLDSKGFPD